MKVRGLGLTALLVFSGVAVSTLPAFAPKDTKLTLRNQTGSTPRIPVYHKPVITPDDPKAPPKPPKATPKPAKSP